MSYDIWLDKGAEYTDTDCPGNYTYNVDPMFALALDGDAEQGVQNGSEVVLHRKDPALRRFVGERAGDCYGVVSVSPEEVRRVVASKLARASWERAA